jgi:hypothetical protein
MYVAKPIILNPSRVAAMADFKARYEDLGC